MQCSSLSEPVTIERKTSNGANLNLLGIVNP